MGGVGRSFFFANGSMVSVADKIESKIEPMLGHAFYEQGDFMSLADLEAQLKASRVKLEQDDDLPDMAEIDYKATISRVDMICRVRENLDAPESSMG